VSDPLHSATRPRLPPTSAGTRSDAFGPTEWGLLAAIAVIWGSSFLFMAIGLEAFDPAVITWARIALGALALAFVPRARRPVDRGDLPRVALLGVVWMAVPLTLFPIAQQWIDSSVAGMLNGAMPLATAVVAAILLRRLPRVQQATGLSIGFLGIVAISWPNVRDADTTALGTVLVLVAIVMYGIAANVTVPLQQRYGSLPVLLRAQLAALVLVTPFGVYGLANSTWSAPAAAAMVPLGVLGTGLAFVLMSVLVGRAGATRGAVAIYFTPLVAIVLGVVARGERIEAIALLGSALVVSGAWLTSRRERP